MREKLGNLCTVKAGHPFRGKIPEQPDGNALAVQVRDISPDGEILWQQVIRTDIKGKKTPNWLRPAHILFAARGQKNHAALVGNHSFQAVCSQHFFLLEVNDESVIDPAFLAWQLNQPLSQRYFTKTAQGTLQVNVTRSHLEDLSISIPPMDQQVALVKLHRTALAEKNLHMALISNRAKQLKEIAHRIINKG